MKDTLLYCAGMLGILLSLVHGWLGQTKVINVLTSPHRVTERLNGAIFHLSTIYWFIGGIALLLAPMKSNPLRGAAAYTVAAMYSAGIAANIWATRGRHFGAYLFAVAAALAILGA